MTIRYCHNQSPQFLLDSPEICLDDAVTGRYIPTVRIRYLRGILERCEGISVENMLKNVFESSTVTYCSGESSSGLQDVGASSHGLTWRKL
jgi:hypothetical protein